MDASFLPQGLKDVTLSHPAPSPTGSSCSRSSLSGARRPKVQTSKLYVQAHFNGRLHSEPETSAVRTLPSR